MISVELAGHTTEVTVVHVVPDQIRGMAGWVISQCIGAGGGLGGFVTGHFGNLVNQMNRPTTNLAAPLRKVPPNLQAVGLR